MNHSAKVINELSQAGYEFLMSDVELALTLLRIASRAGEDGEKRKRNLHNARRAYEKVTELVPRVGLSAEQQETINKKLRTLKSALDKIGQHV